MEGIVLTGPAVRLGVIGCGVVTQSYILPHTNHEDVRGLVDIVAVCDVDAERAEQAARSWGIPSSYGDWEVMVEREALDGLLVLTPIPYHYEQTLAALRSGHHVYVQKPIAETAVEAQELVDVAVEKNKVLVASPGQMLHPGYRRLRTALAEGALGKVYWAMSSTAAPGHERSPRRGVAGGASPAWFYAKGGGPLADMGVYALHTLTGILGPVIAVTALFGRGLPTRQWGNETLKVTVEDNTLLLLDFGDGTLGVCGAHYCFPGTSLGWGFLGIYGSNGSIEIMPEQGTSYPGRVSCNPPDLALEVPLGGETMEFLGESHRALPGYHVWADVRHFIDCVRLGQKPVVNAQQAVHVVEVIEKSHVAFGAGHTQSIESSF